MTKQEKIDKMCELAKFYGFNIHKVAPGEGGIFIDGKELTAKEILKIYFGDFMEEVCDDET